MALARARLLTPGMVVLYEDTSALTTAAELRVVNALRHLGRTARSS